MICKASPRPCSAFTSQLYRPALCSTCFHSVAVHHAPGDWIEESDGGRVYFRCIATGERLFARPGGAELGDIVARVRAAAANAASAVSSNDNIAVSGNRVQNAADSLQARLDSDSLRMISESRKKMLRFNLPGQQVNSTKDDDGNGGDADDEDDDDDDDDDDDADCGYVGDDKDLGGSLGSVDSAPMLASNPNPVVVVGSLPPPSSAPATPPNILAPAFDNVVPNFSIGLQAAAENPPSQLTSSLRRLSLMSTLEASPRQSQEPLPVAVTALSSLPLDPFFEPVSDALLVDTRALGGSAGVFVQQVRQAYDDKYGAERTIIVTPTTIMAIAPHPSRLGVGILKWERSLLSLQGLVTQPLLHPLDRSAPAPLATASTAILEDDSVSFTSGDELLVVDQMPFDILPPSPPQLKSASKNSTGIFSALRGWARGGSEPSAGLAPAAPTPPRSTRGFVIYGVGMLASFAPEQVSSMSLLRTMRGGLKPASREGVLLKRKRSDWRQHAKLGPLAWKRRHVRLEGTVLQYSLRGVPKGQITLEGWVEVARAGADASGGTNSGAVAVDDTARRGAFIVRTASTFHVFQADSSSAADAWVESISVAAQHAAAAAPAPICIITRGHAEAAALAEAVTNRRDALIARAQAAATAKSRGEPLSPADAAILLAANESSRAGISVDLSASAALAGSASRVSASAAISSRSYGDDSAPSSVSVQDALALANALGGVTEELLSQLPRSVALALCEIRRVPLPHSMLPQQMLAPPPPSEILWFYHDPSGAVHGPAPASLCAAWTAANFFDTSTLVRAAAPLQVGSVAAATASAAAALAGPAFAAAWLSSDGLTPLAFLPIGALFASAAQAFLASAPWQQAFANEMAWAALPVWAASAGLGTPATVANGVRGMRASGAPPDPGLFIDVIGA
jgi:hypothetical protein